MNFNSERLYYRSLESKDFRLFYTIFSNEQIMRYAWIDKLDNEVEAKQLFEEFLNKEELPGRSTPYPFAVFSIEDNTFIGFADIMIHSKNSCGGCGEIGYFLIPEHWGKGYATEITRKLIEVGFNQLKLHKMSARCNANNLNSERVMIKSGMTKEGELKKVRFKNGGWDDEKDYGILIEEWSSI